MLCSLRKKGQPDVRGLTIFLEDFGEVTPEIQLTP